MSKFILTIVGDTNDGDYVTENTTVTKEQIDSLSPMIEAIKSSKEVNNFDTNEYQNGDAYKVYGEIDGYAYFSNLVPYGEHGIHTIESITYVPAGDITELL